MYFFQSKRHCLITLFIVFMLVIATAPSAFAESAAVSVTSDDVNLNVTVDKTEVEPGGELTFACVTESNTTPYTSLRLNLRRDSVTGTDNQSLNRIFTSDSFKSEGPWESINISDPGYLDMPNTITTTIYATRLYVSAVDVENPISDVGRIFTWTVKVNETVPVGAEISLKADVTTSVQTEQVYSDQTINIKIVDSTSDPGDGETESPSYTISPVVTDTAKQVGDTFTVSAVVTADQADAGLAAVDAVLNYDKNLVKPVSSTAGAITTNGNFDFDESAGTGKIFAYGNSVPVGDSGVTVATYTFEAVAPGDAVFSIADGALVGQSGNSADIAATAGEAATVTISEAPAEIGLISNETYKGAPDGFQILRYAANALPAEENAFFYGEDTTPLFYAGQDEKTGKHVFLGFVDSTLTEVSPESVQEKSGEYITLAHDGDINLNEAVNAIDSLIAYDLSNGNQTYLEDSGFAALSGQSRLEADVNNDGVVSADDARAAMYKALGIVETVTEPAA